MMLHTRRDSLFASLRCAEMSTGRSLPHRSSFVAFAGHSRQSQGANAQYGKCRSHSSGQKISERSKKILLSPPSAMGQVTAGKDSEIPIDCFRVLGLKSGKGLKPVRDSEITQAYTDLLNSRTLKDQGYSQEVQQSWKDVLDLALDDAIDTKSHSDGPSASFVVPRRLLPAALALLVEVEEYDVMLQVGPSLLAVSDMRSAESDICLAMASANCGVADRLMASADSHKVPSICQRLEQAQELLARSGKGSLDLQSWIRASLLRYQPFSLMEQLSRFGATDAARKEAVEKLGELLESPGRLAAAGADPSLISSHYVLQAMRHLTCAEAVAVFKWEAVGRQAGGGCPPWASSEVLYWAGLAHIAAGFTLRRPGLIKAAQPLLKACSVAGVEVEHAMASVLLGLPDDCFALLQGGGSSDSSAAAPPPGRDGGGRKRMPPGLSRSRGDAPAVAGVARPARAEAMDFILDMSPDSSDLLPGLVLFTENWLREVAFPVFRDTAEQRPSPSLKAYGDNRHVMHYITLHGESRHVMDILMAAVDKAQRPLEGSQRASFEPPPQVPQVQGGLGGFMHPTAADPGSMPASASPGRSAAALREPLPPAAAPAAPRSAATLDAVTPPAQPLPLPAEEPRLAPQIAVGAGAALLLGVALLQPWRAANGTLGGASRLPTAAVRPASADACGLTRAAAQQLVDRWQDTKHAALGPRHELELLDSVLTGKALAHFRSQASRARNDGWHWKYKKHHSKVLLVQAASSDDSSRLRVCAEISEASSLWSTQADTMHEKYQGKYEVQYDVVRLGQGQWKISNVDVLTMAFPSSS